ncbi:large ribosomal subunit protein mL42 isoform X1 [Pantherophis guttatus]|uniref:Large ribosomal subunit protein mL42 n=1 Tax=Pantherophis guttatus TaxID=94885 RepID=A0A6P9AUQ6_PANGU|nr:large ribosomal subunit protein mL42 isoform X1 [Pantherophis guttatus]XP_034259731.1 large ribosomal subunit protein mL42 isoform X1 [Pantherophis guttatus]XP_060550609.1 large ribosomal subunit protein mL42 isoform X1 [Pantherophis guttatus]
MATASRKSVLHLATFIRKPLLTAPVFADAAVFHACPKSTYSPLPDDYNCKVELAMTSDGKTIVCYHPSVDIPYEHTKPIPQLDPVTYKEETHEQVLKSKLEEKEDYKDEPTIEALSKMFYTTKHRWYPVGQYHTRRKKTNTSKDR